ncbi:MAG: YifB family Mg chelatase-like AAA ATPase [Clostridium sp.]|nr:YifB family Mg chelatase-like AAA ATPase [Clostridium sp.]
MFSTIISGAVQGMSAYLAEVEVDVATGLPGFHMVGYLSGEVREARERVQVALRNTGFELRPMKITVNLSPADVRKEGTGFDLPVAVGMLESLGYFGEEAAARTLFLGELGLDGEIKPVKGVLPIVREAASKGVKTCIVPKKNVLEGAAIPGVDVRGAHHIEQILRFLQAKGSGREEILPAVKVDLQALFCREAREEEDFREVRGQEAAKRAAEIAAAGFHNLLMSGPPGAGKSMIAKRIAGILPPISMEESLEVSAIYSVAGRLKESQSLLTKRPFQSPHHNITQAALVGGSTIPQPGMISLSHRGVLFLDELPEFERSVLDSMRQPLEDHQVQIARLHGNVSYPAHFMLICAMNPCACGYFPDKNRCVCKETEVKRYLGKVSGPILDRIDLCTEILPVKMTQLKGGEEESSGQIRERVLRARYAQEQRFQGSAYHFNSEIRAADMEKYCRLNPAEQKLMERAYEGMGLSARAYHKILKVARTIADLAGEEEIRAEQLTEALYYRTAENRLGRK